MMTKLKRRVKGQWDQGYELVGGGAFLIGRDVGCDICLEDVRASRRHAQLTCIDGMWIVHDLGSHNRTYVNGFPINGALHLRNGDVVRVGDTELMFEDASQIESVDDDLSRHITRSVSHWLYELQNGIDKRQAQDEIWNRYYERLVRFVDRNRKQYGLPGVVENEEDASLSALDSFFDGAAAKSFPRLENREDFWRILATIAARKVIRQYERHVRIRTGDNQVLRETDLRGNDDRRPLNVIGTRKAWPPRNNPTEVLDLEFRETLDLLLARLADDRKRRVAKLKMAGFSTTEIAEAVAIHRRTVERDLAEIRESWQSVLLDR